MSRYFWTFGFFAVEGCVPKLPRSYQTMRVPPKPATGKSLPGPVAPILVKALKSKDKDVDDLLLVTSLAFATKSEAEQFLLMDPGKLLYRRAANAVLYELRAEPAGGPRREAKKKTAAKKRSTKRAATKKRVAKKR